MLPGPVAAPTPEWEAFQAALERLSEEGRAEWLVRADGGWAIAAARRRGWALRFRTDGQGLAAVVGVDGGDAAVVLPIVLGLDDLAFYAEHCIGTAPRILLNLEALRELREWTRAEVASGREVAVVAGSAAALVLMVSDADAHSRRLVDFAFERAGYAGGALSIL